MDTCTYVYSVLKPRVTCSSVYSTRTTEPYVYMYVSPRKSGVVSGNEWHLASDSANRE